MSSKQQSAEKSKNVWETKKVEEAIMKRASASPPPESSPSSKKAAEKESGEEKKLGVQRQHSTPREEAREAEEKERTRRIKEEKKPDEVPIKKENLEKIHKEILKREQVSPAAAGEGSGSFEREAAFSGKEEEHSDIESVHCLEEEERQRRLKEEKPLTETPGKSQLFKSLSKEICEKQKGVKAEVVEGVGSQTVDQGGKSQQTMSPDPSRSQQRSQADFIGTVIDEEEEKRRRAFDEDEKYRETLAHGFSEQAKGDIQKLAAEAEACSTEGVGTGAKQQEVDTKIREEDKLMQPTAEEMSYQKYQYDKEHVKEQLEKEKLHDEAAIIGAVIDEGQELRRRLSHPDEEHKREELAHQLAGSVKDQLAPKAALADAYSTSGVGTASKSQEVDEKFGSEFAQQERRLEKTVEELKELEQVNADVFQTGPGIKESGVEIKEKIELTTVAGKPTEKVETTATTPGGEEMGLPNPKIVIKETGVKLTTTPKP